MKAVAEAAAALMLLLLLLLLTLLSPALAACLPTIPSVDQHRCWLGLEVAW